MLDGRCFVSNTRLLRASSNDGGAYPQTPIPHEPHTANKHSPNQAVIGSPIDKSLIREVNRTSRKNDRNSAARFFKNGHLAYPLTDTPRQSRKFVRGMKRLEEVIPATNAFNRQFLDLLRKIFVYDPKKRITAREALKHPWFAELVEDDGTEAGRIREERKRQKEEEGVALAAAAGGEKTR